MLNTYGWGPGMLANREEDTDDRVLLSYCTGMVTAVTTHCLLQISKKRF